MRKIFIVFITVIMLIILGCSNQLESENSISSNLKVKESNYSEEDSSAENTILYDYEESYNMSAVESIFQKKMKANPIDKKYYDEFSLATTTAEFCSLEKKYIDIWKNELDFAIDKFTNVLTPTDKEDFLQIQKAWESSTLDQINFERNFIDNQEEYNIYLGTSFQYLNLSEIREAYRERTFRVKYLLYLCEQSDTKISEADYQSLIFLRE